MEKDVNEVTKIARNIKTKLEEIDKDVSLFPNYENLFTVVLAILTSALNL